METSWSLEPIFNYVSLAQGFAVNSKSRHVIKEKGELPLLRITDLINSTKSQFIDADSIAAKFVASPDELIYTRTGQVGLVFRNKHGVVHNNCFKVIPNESLDKDYLYWFLKQRRVIEYVNSIASGSVQKDLNHKSFLTLELPIPDVKEQRAIAQILDALENKIELNRQMNETLEAIAQALFKSWFVDFDPVIDNALAAGNEIPEPLQACAATRQTLGDQRKPLPPEIQAQFPSSFVFTDEIGWVPEGWNVSNIGSHCDFKNGFAFKSGDLTDYTPTSLPVFKMGSIQRGGGFKPEGTKSYIEEASVTDKMKQHMARKGDLLMSMTDMKANMAILGNTALMPVDEKYLVNQRVGIIRANQNSHLNYPYLYFYTNDSDVVSELRSRANSGVQVNLTTQAIKDTHLLVPDHLIHDAFDRATLYLLEKTFQTELMNAPLASLRDSLLPKLLSGELRVTDVEDKVAEVL